MMMKRKFSENFGRTQVVGDYGLCSEAFLHRPSGTAEGEGLVGL